jgi:plastocyanin
MAQSTAHPVRRTILAGAAMFAATCLLVTDVPLRAADEMEVTISIKDHKFEPAEVKVPAGKALKLTVNNLDATPEEFESKPLKIEKVIAGKSSAVIRVKPLAKGTYKFFGEYNEKTAQGVIIAE